MNLNVKMTWDAMLSDVRKVFPSAVLAGGAVRDYVLSFPAKDWDFFVNVKEEELLAGVSGLNALPSFLNVEHDIGKQTEYAEDVTLACEGVLSGEWLSAEGVSYPIQIIARPIALGSPLPKYYLDTLMLDFDLGICSIGYDGKEVSACSRFHRDILNKTLTIHRNNSPKDLFNAYEHASRLLQRSGFMHWQIQSEWPKPDLNEDPDALTKYL